MKSITEQTLDYFLATNNDFWKWGENGTVIEWTSEITICYREDLILILRGLAPYGLPPIGSILLVMTACQKKWKSSHFTKEEFKSHFDFFKKMARNNLLESHYEDAIQLMNRINELPESLRTGTNRIHLFQEIFKKSKSDSIENPEGIIDEFLSGKLDEKIFTRIESVELSAENLRKDLWCLASAVRQFSSKESLELAIRTGLKEIPEPIDLEKKEEEDHEEKSLLDQLKDDAKTEGIARLCQRIIAGLNIPMHSQGVSDQSFGGVSDITNRGDIDKLLLSELAYDDTTLMVRLANNEAMYLRREELPSNLHKERIILIDSTIKMWGVPRVFATSVGLACAIQDENVNSISSYILSGEKSHSVDLSTKEGVTKGLEELHPELHCADALHLFVEENTINEQTELILITDEVSLQDEDFKKTLNEVRDALTYLITINRTGHLHFYEYSLSGRRLVSKTLYDLDELLFKKEKRTIPFVDKTVSKELPEIYQHQPFPLLYPSPSIRFTRENTFDLGKGGVAAVTNDNRILYWEKRGLGAKELLNGLQQGNKIEITYAEGIVFVLEMSMKEVVTSFTYSKKVLHKWYAFDQTVENRSYELDFSDKDIFVQYVQAKYGRFYFIDFERNIFYIDELSGSIESSDEKIIFSGRDKPNFSRIKKVINNGYTTLRKAKKIVLLSNRDNFKLNDWELKFKSHAMWFEQTKGYGSDLLFREEDIKDGEIRFRKVTFSEGSQIITDTRGFMHLISSDNNIPQITIPMVVGGFTTAWTSDGTVAGNQYFFGESNPNKISPKEFEQRYFLPFMENISLVKNK